MSNNGEKTKSEIEDISEKQIEQAESKLYGLAENGLLEQGPKNFDHVLTDTIKQIDKKENFRRIIDLKNNSGWIHVSQLKRINSVIATKDKVLFKKSSSFAKPIAMIKKGRLLIVQKCEKNWCEIKTDDFNGWIKTDDLWGLTN